MWWVLLLLAGSVAWSLPCRAAEPGTTLLAVAHAGAGKLAYRQSVVAASEAGDADNPTGFDVKYLGLGARGETQLVRDDDAPSQGGFASLGLAYEWRGMLARCCNLSSSQHYAGGHAGYLQRWRRVEVRLGLVTTRSVGHPRWGRSALLLPDVWLRLGARQRGWVELGFGSYDTVTLLRPGAFLGAGFGPRADLRVTLHAGVNAGDGSFGHDGSLQLGARADLGVLLDVTPSWAAGLSGALQVFGDEAAEAAVTALSRF